MIKEMVVVARYAEAFIGLANQTFGLEKALEELQAVKNIIRDNPEFSQLMASPEISHAEKCLVIDKIIRNGFSEEMRNFLKLLLEKKHFNIFPEITEYLRVKYAHQGSLDVLLKTAFPLDLDLIEKIETALREKFQKELRFYIDLDGSLLGGVQVIMGNTIIDGSLIKRLNELRDKLISVRIE